MSEARGAPTRVAVIGGGCAALTAAFELTRPEHEGRYAVTVYQMGWRLGGKGASGRGVHGRIEEHGLHLWMGYYENAFRIMRECYAEALRSTDAFGSFESAFSPAGFNGAMDWSPKGEWLTWKVDFPAMPGLPGDPNPPRFNVADYLTHAARLLRSLFSTLSTGTGSVAGSTLGARPTPEDLTQFLSRAARFGAVLGLGALIQAITWLEPILRALPEYPQSLVVAVLDALAGQAQKAVAGLIEDDEARRLWEVAELILVTIRGCIQSRVVFHEQGFDMLDGQDCRDWLKENGASPGALNSAFIRALYDLAFAYRDGDPGQPAIAAGSAVRGAFRAFFSYRGAFFWRMNSGMGDAVFAPLYWVLRQRGVRFEFFHKLTDVAISTEDAPHVSSLAFDVQAEISGAGEYAPLCDVNGQPCWPAKPRFEQLVGGATLAESSVDFESQSDSACVAQKTLQVGLDFDFVVLGVGLGVLPSVCGALIARDERWRQMIEHVKCVPTQAFQVWLRPDMAALGWSDRPINVSGYVEPFDTWADMSHLIPKENWPERPGALAYFCSVLPERSVPFDAGLMPGRYAALAHECVRVNCIEFLNKDIAVLWPRALDARGQFAWSTLCGASGADSSEEFTTQYWTANVRPSDRYSQALPGSTEYRISPLDRSYDNLTLAGDWTSCAVNMGCVEAAVLSGRLAAHALSGSPQLSDIVGFDHP
ncbi:MAG: NAD(P)-binding protein [Pseudomonadota bacterium]